MQPLDRAACRAAIPQAGRAVEQTHDLVIPLMWASCGEIPFFLSCILSALAMDGGSDGSTAGEAKCEVGLCFSSLNPFVKLPFAFIQYFH